MATSKSITLDITYHKATTSVRLIKGDAVSLRWGDECGQIFEISGESKDEQITFPTHQHITIKGPYGDRVHSATTLLKNMICPIEKLEKELSSLARESNQGSDHPGLDLLVVTSKCADAFQEARNALAVALFPSGHINDLDQQLASATKQFNSFQQELEQETIRDPLVFEGVTVYERLIDEAIKQTEEGRRVVAIYFGTGNVQRPDTTFSDQLKSIISRIENLELKLSAISTSTRFSHYPPNIQQQMTEFGDRLRETRYYIDGGVRVFHNDMDGTGVIDN